MSAKHPNERPEVDPIPNRPFPLKRVVGALLMVALAFAAAAVLAPRDAHAKDAIGLGAGDVKTIKRIQTHLNAIQTLSSRFMQVTDRGHFAQGEFMMRRPGKLRIDYDDPMQVLIISDGTWVMYKDEELDQISHLPFSQLPAAMFIGDKIDFFGDDLLITGFADEAGVVRVTLQRAEDPMEGSLTLAFEQKPLKLKKWSVVDAQGITTTFSLLGAKFGAKLPTDEDLFKVEHRLLGR